MTTHYASLVCWDCGQAHGRRPEKAMCMTVWMDTCSICGERKQVSPFYDYGGPKTEEK